MVNWTRIIIATVVGGIAVWLASFFLHGIVMGATYAKYPDLFIQEEGNPFWFLVLEVLIALPAAIIFARTRRCWSAGVMGGVTFGFWIGAFGWFAQFFNPLVIQGFPYYLAWCWAGINMIVSLILGAVLGSLVKET